MGKRRSAQAVLFVFVLCLISYQNCSGNKFGAAAGGSSAAGPGSASGSILATGTTATGQIDQPVSVTGQTASGTIVGVGAGAGSGVLIATPLDFSQSSCTIAYPYASSTPATNVKFNESDVLAAFSPSTLTTAAPGQTVSVWYSDEHAMMLGVRRVDIITAAGTTSTDFAVSPLTANPGLVINPSIGAADISGDKAGIDTSTCPGVPYACSRPMFPALFITDITSDSGSTAGDWQFGGKPVPPHLVAGTWKAAVRTVDMTRSTPAVTIAVDPDPDVNNSNLGGLTAPNGVGSEGYSAVVSWEISRLGLASGHTYRLQFMVHDGDQNKSGGDAGMNCVNLKIP